MEDRSAKTVAERWSVLVQSTLQEIQFYLRDLHDELPMKTVHQLRLALKRLRVLLAVLEQTRDGLKQVITLQKSVNKLFEVAGILRDAQVRRGLLEEEHSLHFLLPEADKNVRKAEKRFRMHQKEIKSSTFNFRKSLGNYLLTLDQDALENAMWYLQLKYLGRIHIRHGIPEDENLHAIRTALKRLVELQKIRIEVGMVEAMTARLEVAKSMAQEIGTWHDHHLLNQYMTRTLRKKGTDEAHRNHVANRQDIQQVRRLELEGLINNWVQETRKAFPD